MKKKILSMAILSIVLISATFSAVPIVEAQEQVDVIVHIEEFHVKASPGDPFWAPDPDVFMRVRVGPVAGGTVDQKSPTDWGADICSDAGLVCFRFRFKGVTVVNGKILFSAEVYDEDCVYPNDDDYMGGTNPAGQWAYPPWIPAVNQTQTIDTEYVSCTLRITIVGYCQANCMCGSFRHMPESVQPNSTYETTIELNVTEENPPDSLNCTEILPWNFEFVSSDPPAEISTEGDGDEEFCTVVRWEFTGPEIYDRELTYWAISSEEPEAAWIAGYLSMPLEGRVSHFGSSLINVASPLPTITSITPNHGNQGETLDVIITGTNFAGATGVSFGAGITVNSFNVDSSAQITANITIDDYRPIGSTAVSVTTLGGTAILVDGFTVEKGGICFIATAAYGSPMAEEIEVLREFRDEYLLTNPVGKALVDLYYQISPPMAEFITEHPALKPVVRAGLVPAIAMSTVAVNTTLVEKIAIAGSMALVSVALAVWAMRRRGRDPEYT